MKPFSQSTMAVPLLSFVVICLVFRDFKIVVGADTDIKGTFKCTNTVNSKSTTQTELSSSITTTDDDESTLGNVYTTEDTKPISTARTAMTTVSTTTNGYTTQYIGTTTSTSTDLSTGSTPLTSTYANLETSPITMNTPTGSTPLTSTYANPETSPITTNTPTGSTPLTSTYANPETSPIMTNTPTAVAADRACSHQYNAFCYELFYDEKTFAEAHRTCLSLGSGSNLASIADQYENDFLKVLIVDYSSQPEVDYWIGLTNTRYRWFNGKLLLYANFNQDLSNCVVVNGNDFSWKSNPCEDTKIFVCEKKKDRDTPCSEFEYNGSCYTKSLVPGSINFAINECSNNGANLLQIETYDEQQFVEDNVIGTDDVWLNLITTGSNGHSWSDGTNVNYDYYGSEYKQHGGICFRLNRDDGWHWNDDNCNIKHNFVCKWTR